MTGPLAGTKVLDLSQVIAGPYGSALLADAGAEVIKIEALTGEMARALGPLFLAMNRGKRSIPINLQHDDGKELLRRLAMKSDVLIENFRPGVMARFGLEYAALAEINPRLVYVSVSAFGASGPYAHRPGFDPLLQAMSGTERAQGGRHNPPVFLRIAITDYATGLMQAAAVSMALYRREITGRGDHINTSLLRNGIFINGEAFTRYEGRPERVLTDVGQHGLGAFDRMYRCSDGAYIFVVAPDEETERNLWRVVYPQVIRPEATTGEGILEERFAEDTSDIWLAKLEAAGVPCSPVITEYSKHFFEDVQPMINAYVVRAEHPVRGHIEQAANLIRYSLSQTSQENIATPLLGQHTDAVLAELGYGVEAIARLKAAGTTA